MSPSPETTDATEPGSEDLLRAWFHWFCTDPDAPVKLPEGLHVKTAAYLAARAMETGRRFHGPRDL